MFFWLLMILMNLLILSGIWGNILRGNAWCMLCVVHLCIHYSISITWHEYSLLYLPFKAAENTQSDTSISSGEASKRSIHFLPNETKLDPQLENKDLNTKEKSDPVVDEDDVEGDSFFDDPVPKPERTFSW